MFPLLSNTKISFTVVVRGVDDKFNVFKVASDPLTISFFQFGMLIFFIMVGYSNESTSVMAYNMVIHMNVRRNSQ